MGAHLLSTTLVLIVTLVVPMAIYMRRRSQKQEKPTFKWTTNPDFYNRDIQDDYYCEPEQKMNPSHINLIGRIGRGHFGEVHEGVFIENESDSDEDLRVAIKFLRREKERDFHKERDVLMKFGKRGSHIVYYYGWSRLQRELGGDWEMCLIFEFIEHGNLKGYLHHYNVKRSEKRSEDLMTMRRVMKMCADIADGMLFLSESEVVHRDLAARNCLVSRRADEEYETIKICDFGMTRELDIEESCSIPYYVPAAAAAIPIRWWPPETIEPPHKFTTESDIWSYGVLLFEIGSLGEMPYEGDDDNKIRERLGKDYRSKIREYNVLWKPEWKKLIIDNLGTLGISAPDADIYIIDLIRKCCAYEPHKRPKFEDILKMIDAIWEEGLSYYQDDYYFLSDRRTETMGGEVDNDTINAHDDTVFNATQYIEDECHGDDDTVLTDPEDELEIINDQQPLLPPTRHLQIQDDSGHGFQSLNNIFKM